MSRYICTILLVLNSLTSWAATYYASPTGSTANNGLTPTTPWPLDFANKQLFAGDTLILRGGNYGAKAVAPIRSGTAVAKITYTNYVGETPLLTDPVSSTIPQGIWLHNGRSYVRVFGITITNTARWITMGNGGLGTGAGHHNEIGRCFFRNRPAGPFWNTVQVVDGASYNWFHDNQFYMQGGVQANGDDFGTMFVLGSQTLGNENTHHNLVENNIFGYGGHDCFTMGKGHQNVFRTPMTGHRHCWATAASSSTGPTTWWKGTGLRTRGGPTMTRGLTGSRLKGCARSSGGTGLPTMATPGSCFTRRSSRTA
jgi:hypothetical protein